MKKSSTHTNVNLVILWATDVYTCIKSFIIEMYYNRYGIYEKIYLDSHLTSFEVNLKVFK